MWNMQYGVGNSHITVMSHILGNTGKWDCLQRLGVSQMCRQSVVCTQEVGQLPPKVELANIQGVLKTFVEHTQFVFT